VRRPDIPLGNVESAVTLANPRPRHCSAEANSLTGPGFAPRPGHAGGGGGAFPV
jgi:hypothetical protein